MLLNIGHVIKVISQANRDFLKIIYFLILIYCF